MIDDAPGEVEASLALAIRERLGSEKTGISGGYQGAIDLVEVDGHRYVVKTPTGRGVARALRQFMLRNEHRVYRRLRGLRGTARCYGLLDGRHLVLEHLEGEGLRYAEIDDRRAFYGRFLELIQELHRLGIAHGDLKKKENVIVIDQEPYVIDFGTAVALRKGFHPLNHLMFRMARAWDLNAWVKRKHGTYDPRLVGEDGRLVQVTFLERFSLWVRRPWRALMARLGITAHDPRRG